MHEFKDCLNFEDPDPIYLFKHDNLCNILKHKFCSFYGVVSSIEGEKKNSNFVSNKKVQTILTLESTIDKSKAKIYVHHWKKVNLEGFLKKGDVLVIRKALKKLTSSIEICFKVEFDSRTIAILGRC